MSGILQGKSIIVTGAGRGIGAEISRDLARHGASVCVADLNMDAAQKAVDELKTAMPMGGRGGRRGGEGGGPGGGAGGGNGGGGRGGN